MEQLQLGFSEKTPKAVMTILKIGKKFDVHYN